MKIGTLVTGNENYWITNSNSISIVLANGENDTQIIVGTIESSVDFTKDIIKLTDATLREFAAHPTDYKFHEYGIYIVDVSDFTPITLLDWEEQKRSDRKNYYASPNKEILLTNFLSAEDGITYADIPKEAPAILDPHLYKYTFSQEQKNAFMSKASALLYEFGHPCSKKGLEKIWDEYTRNKAGLAGLLSKHPYWDDSQLAIVFPADYDRVRDDAVVAEFCDWIKNQLTCLAKENEYKPGGMTRNELYNSLQYLATIINCIRSLSKTQKSLTYSPWETSYRHSILVDGRTKEEYDADYERIKELYDFACDNTKEYDGYYVKADFYNKLLAAYNFTDLIKSKKMITADTDFAKRANSYAKPFEIVKNGKKIGLGAVKDQKVSRITGKFYKYLGIDKIVDIREETFTETDAEGHATQRTRQRDYGWNGKYAAFCDAINPFKVKKWTIISVNPIDYFTMSFGNTWNSCMTIDKANRRKKGSDGYRGMYCSGTESYMLDETSFLMYIVKGDYEGNEFSLEDKESRCMFWIGEDKLVQGRVYPDGRNAGAETSMAGQMRSIMQKVIADCAETANLWTITKGTEMCGDLILSNGTHYRDYYHYEDCNISFLKRQGVLKNIKKFSVGHNPICPCCGKTHSNGEYLACSSCRDKHKKVMCDHCGEWTEDVSIFDEDREVYYCCENCANEEGCYYCSNVNEWHSEYVFYDPIADEYFYDRYAEDYTHFTINGTEHHYLCDENAEANGFCYVNGKWYDKSDESIVKCPHCGGYSTRRYIENNHCCSNCGVAMELEPVA